MVSREEGWYRKQRDGKCQAQCQRVFRGFPRPPGRSAYTQQVIRAQLGVRRGENASLKAPEGSDNGNDGPRSRSWYSLIDGSLPGTRKMLQKQMHAFHPVSNARVLSGRFQYRRRHCVQPASPRPDADAALDVPCAFVEQHAGAGPEVDEARRCLERKSAVTPIPSAVALLHLPMPSASIKSERNRYERFLSCRNKIVNHQ